MNRAADQYWQTVRRKEKTMENVQSTLEKLFENAEEKIIEQNHLGGDWRARIANPESPQNYIEMELTGYSSSKFSELTCSFTKVINNEIAEEKDFNFRIDSSDFKESVQTAFRNMYSQTQNYMELKLQEIGAKNYVVYSALNVPMSQHYQLLKDNGYPVLPAGQEGQKTMYVGYAYKNGVRGELLKGSSPDEIIKTILDQGRRTGDAFDKICHIGEHDPETNRYNNFKEYDISQYQKQEDQPVRKRQKSKCIGYAYFPGAEKPQVIFGGSTEEILQTLGKWNKNRKPENAYDFCNIGEYAPESAKYQNFERYNVKTGERIQKYYLSSKELFKEDKNKEEFQQHLQQLKAEGVQFDPKRKQWYVTDLKLANEYEFYMESSSLSKYLLKGERYKSDFEKKTDALLHAESIKKEWVVQLVNGDSMRINANEANTVTEICEKIEEHMEQRKNSVNQKDPLMEKIKAAEPEMRPGEYVKVQIPAYTTLHNGIREISGIETVEGTLCDIDNKKGFTIALKDGTHKVLSTIYNDRQAFIINMAISKKITGASLDLIADPRLSAAQMEQVFNGIMDGIHPYRVAEYANPDYAVWQMDLYRYGMGNGLPFGSIKEVVTTCTEWEESRRLIDTMIKTQRNEIIRDLKNNHFIPEKRLVGKIEKLNGLSGKLNSVKDLLQKNPKTFGVNSEIGQLAEEIGKDLKHQQICRARIPDPHIEKVPAP